MRSKETNTKGKILDLAENLLKKVGFNAFSYHHIADHLGVKKAAVHYHYPTKAVLGTEVLERARHKAYLWMQKTEAMDDPEQKLDFFINTVYGFSLKQDNSICLIGSLSTDFFTIPEAMKDPLHKMVQEIWDWLAAMLEEGRSKAVFSFQGEARSKAMLITTSLAGALQIARVAGNESYHKVVEQLKKDLQQQNI